MKTKLITYLILSILLLFFISCKDDKEGAKFLITIQQSGDYENYEKEMILLSAGGLYDEINKKDINSPILEDEYFRQNFISISTKEYVNLFIATLHVNKVKEDAVDPENMKWEIRLYKNNQLVYEEIKEYEPNMKFPQILNVSRD